MRAALPLYRAWLVSHALTAAASVAMFYVAKGAATVDDGNAVRAPHVELPPGYYSMVLAVPLLYVFSSFTLVRRAAPNPWRPALALGAAAASAAVVAVCSLLVEYPLMWAAAWLLTAPLGAWLYTHERVLKWVAGVLAVLLACAAVGVAFGSLVEEGAWHRVPSSVDDLP